MTHKTSLFTYLIVIFEGLLILGSFSYIGAFISKVYQYNFLQIGLIMTGFGIMTVIGGRLSGKIADKIGKKRILITGLGLAALADLVLFTSGNVLGVLILGVALLGLGFIFAHSTLLTMATEFAQKARGTAMSLVAACFMGGGGIGTAIGGILIKGEGFTDFFLYYGMALIVLFITAMFLINVKETLAEARMNKNLLINKGGIDEH